MAAKISIVGSINIANSDFWRSPDTDSPNRGFEQDTRVDEGESQAAKQLGKRIAVVDDEELLASLFSRLLSSLGYRTEFVAHDGAEIVQAVSEGAIHPDLILMDYRMPKMNGLEAAEKLRQARPDLKIIIATADDSIGQRAISAGLMFIPKPFSSQLLAKTVEEALQ